MKPFFTPMDVIKWTGMGYASDCAQSLNARLESEGVRVYIDKNRGGNWVESKINDASYTHTAILLNIQPIEAEKPECEIPHHILRSISRQGSWNYCPACGEKLVSE